MNLELNGHKITLGPKALAFIETKMRGMGEVYCRDQLALWLAGGKVDADVRIEGPARFVAVGNEIGLPMKAGAEARERPVGKTGSTEPLPVASAAPADPYEPVGTMPVVGDWVVDTRFPPGGEVTCIDNGVDFQIRFGANNGARLAYFNPAPNPACNYWRIRKRQAPDAGLQVWRYGSARHIVKKDGTFLISWGGGGAWLEGVGKWGELDSAASTRLTGPEAAKAIAEARAQGVL